MIFLVISHQGKYFIYKEKKYSHLLKCLPCFSVSFKGKIIKNVNMSRG